MCRGRVRPVTSSKTEAFQLLTTHGNLVKRGFLLGDGFGIIGFKETDWED